MTKNKSKKTAVKAIKRAEHKAVKAVHEARPPKKIAKRKGRSKIKSSAVSTSAQVSAMEDADSAQAVFQMTDADAVYARWVENATESKTRFMVAPPSANELATVNWATATRLTVTTVPWAAGTEQSARVWLNPAPNGHVTVATAFDVSGKATAYTGYNVQGYSNLAAQYESIQFAGGILVVKALSPELNKGGLVTGTCYQNVGSGYTAIMGLSRADVYNLDCYQWPPNSTEKARFCLISNSWSDDFGERSPTGTPNPTDGCAMVEIAAPSGVAETYEIIAYACWAGVPLASIFSAEAASGTAKPTPSCVSESKARLHMTLALAKLPQFCTARCVAADGVKDPRAWLVDSYDKGKSAYDSFSKAFSGKGGFTGTIGNLWDGARAVGGFLGNIGSLFSEEEIVARMTVGMHPDRLALIAKHIKAHGLPNR